MALIERLMQLEEPWISAHGFMAVLGEVERGKMTAAQAINVFALDAAAQVEANSLISKIVSPPESISLGGFVTLTNIGNTYDAITASRGLGVCRIEYAGISGFEFGVSVNKIGTGTQSWQLWNETDGVEIAVIDDAGAAGNKQIATSASFAPVTVASLKTLRVRAKSTVAADDPLYYGASLIVRRVGIMTPDVLHQLLLAADLKIPPYDTPAGVRSRLGL